MPKKSSKPGNPWMFRLNPVNVQVKIPDDIPDLLKPIKPVGIREHSWLARMAAAKLGTARVAIVIGHTIHLYGISIADFLQNKAWLRHELCHVKQYEAYGLGPFIARYLWESLRKGYRQNRFEVEARRAEAGEV